jgi:hypothetical protein
MFSNVPNTVMPYTDCRRLINARVQAGNTCTLPQLDTQDRDERKHVRMMLKVMRYCLCVVSEWPYITEIFVFLNAVMTAYTYTDLF